MFISEKKGPYTKTESLNLIVVASSAATREISLSGRPKMRETFKLDWGNWQLWSLLHQLKSLLFCHLQRDGKIHGKLERVRLVNISCNEIFLEVRRTWRISFTISGDMVSKMPILRTWSTHQAFCWQGMLEVLIMGQWGLTRKRARTLRWPGLDGSNSLKGRTWCW